MYGRFPGAHRGALVSEGSPAMPMPHLQMYEKDRIHPWPYNKGFKRNFEEVFGRRCADDMALLFTACVHTPDA